MADRDLILDPSQIDLSRLEADAETIQRYLPQRCEMQQVTAICFTDSERLICVGYKDVTDKEFWCRGHLPGWPLMPGVVMCEVAAQVCSYYIVRYLVPQGTTIGLSGLDEVRFRDMVRPGDRLVIVATMIKHRPGLLFVCRFQGFVGERLVCEGQMRGIVLRPAEAPQA